MAWLSPYFEVALAVSLLTFVAAQTLSLDRGAACCIAAVILAGVVWPVVLVGAAEALVIVVAAGLVRLLGSP